MRISDFAVAYENCPFAELRDLLDEDLHNSAHSSIYFEADIDHVTLPVWREYGIFSGEGVEASWKRLADRSYPHKNIRFPYGLRVLPCVVHSRSFEVRISCFAHGSARLIFPLSAYD